MKPAVCGDSIVAVAKLTDEGTLAVGSGVMIGPGLMVTASHVLEEFPKEGSEYRSDPRLLQIGQPWVILSDLDRMSLVAHEVSRFNRHRQAHSLLLHRYGQARLSGVGQPKARCVRLPRPLRPIQARSR